MRKTIKRLGAVLLAIAMAVSVLCTGALAAESKYVITINGKSTDHTYEAYQVFSGTVDMTSTTLSDVQWGSAISGKSTEFLDALRADTTIGNDFPATSVTTAAQVADVLAGYTKDKDAKAKAFAAVVGKFITEQNITTNLTSTNSSTTDGVTHYTIDVGAAGYYFIKDRDNTVTNPNSATQYILKVVGPTSVNSKDGTVPTVKKEVTTAGQKTETSNIGDSVKFILTGELPSNYADYKEPYVYEFHDTLSKGLTYNDDVKVYVQNNDTKVEIKKDSTDGYTVSPEGKQTDNDQQTNLTVKFTNLKAAKAATDGQPVTITKTSKIIVEYTATLNQYAEVGTTGNTNEVKLVYSNDPNKDGKGETTLDKVTVYTFQLNVDKVDSKDKTTNNNVVTYNKHLAGAEFKLYIEVGENNTTKWATVENGKLTGWVDSEANGTTLTTNEQGKIAVAGLKDGTYYLKEVKAPDGYNLPTGTQAITPITLTAATSEGNVFTGALDSTKDNTETNKSSVDTGTTGNATVTIENTAGSTLPSTGGMGTKLFYTIGGILMAGAAIVLVVRKRRSDAE